MHDAEQGKMSAKWFALLLGGAFLTCDVLAYWELNPDRYPDVVEYPYVTVFRK